jgi:hypothetical protein
MRQCSPIGWNWLIKLWTGTLLDDNDIFILDLCTVQWTMVHTDLDIWLFYLWTLLSMSGIRGFKGNISLNVKVVVNVDSTLLGDRSTRFFHFCFFMNLHHSDAGCIPPICFELYFKIENIFILELSARSDTRWNRKMLKICNRIFKHESFMF